MQHYVRFRTSIKAAESAAALGVFHAVGRLEDAEAFDPWSAECAEETCQWFNKHLAIPRLRPNEQRAVFWFRAERSDMVQRLWNLSWVLREHGVAVELIHTTNPGKVCYEDKFQVAAIPWRRRHRSGKGDC
jgi:hypothetical protein